MTYLHTSALFVTATDTGVGKTTMTAALILALRHKGENAGVMKPIETGVDPAQYGPSDADRLRSLISPPPEFDSVCLYAFSEPLAPLACAQETGKIIEISRIVSSFRHLVPQYTYLLVEGAGGVFTPITPTQTMREVIINLNLPVLIVGKTTLGGVNHLLLTLETLEKAGIPRCGVILNDSVKSGSSPRQRHSTIELIRKLSTAPVFGPVEYQERLESHWLDGVKTLAAHPEIQRLVEHLIQMPPRTGKVPVDGQKHQG